MEPSVSGPRRVLRLRLESSSLIVRIRRLCTTHKEPMPRLFFLPHNPVQRAQYFFTTKMVTRFFRSMNSTIIAEIEKVLEEDVRPMVGRHLGNVEFVGFN